MEEIEHEESKGSALTIFINLLARSLEDRHAAKDERDMMISDDEDQECVVVVETRKGGKERDFIIIEINKL